MILITSWYRDKLIQSHTSSCCSSHTSCFYTYFKWILYEQEYSTEWDGEEGMVVKHKQSVTIHGSVLDLNRTDCAVLMNLANEISGRLDGHENLPALQSGHKCIFIRPRQPFTVEFISLQAVSPLHLVWPSQPARCFVLAGMCDPKLLGNIIIVFVTISRSKEVYCLSPNINLSFLSAGLIDPAVISVTVHVLMW